MNINQDILWKGIIEDLAVDFITYFFPDAIDYIDFERNFEFLDKELIQLFGDAYATSKYADKLIKIFTKTGIEKWILVHVEIQGYRDLNFEKRMYTYFYRIFDRYQQNITAIAIFTDEEPNYFPNQFMFNFLGTTLNYTYNTYKVILQSEAALIEDRNPFAKVILACLLWLKNKKSSEDNILSIKISLIRQLLKYSYDEHKIRSIFEFINQLIRFKNPETFLYI